MFARRAAEVAAAFPASWSTAKKATTVSPSKGKEDSSLARNVAYRQHQLHKYLIDRAKEGLIKSEMQTKMEREEASKQGASELNHLKDISQKVYAVYYSDLEFFMLWNP